MGDVREVKRNVVYGVFRGILWIWKLNERKEVWDVVNDDDDDSDSDCVDWEEFDSDYVEIFGRFM